MTNILSDYPVFEADQVLTNKHLNDSFNYLEQQVRLTRANLTGIGIVCGLGLTFNSRNTSVKIEKGCGITSEGYLILVDDNTYSYYTNYDAKKNRLYTDRFVTTYINNRISPASVTTDQIPLWELHKSAAEQTADGQTPQPLSELQLGDKVVLLFVELLELINKNCNPTNCDDKGTTIEVHVRPLLVERSRVTVNRLNRTSGSINASDFFDFPVLKMPRWNVPGTSPVTSDEIINAYHDVLTDDFIETLQRTLSNAYSEMGVLLGDEFSSNPFEDLANILGLINTGKASVAQILLIQYYYDFVSDLAQAYDEFCKRGVEFLNVSCCPDPELFPRHLLLGEVIPSQFARTIVYRHNFIYSTLFDNKDRLSEIKSLFRRLVSMVSNFRFRKTVSLEKSEIRITPSNLGNFLLSDKAIPYYYTPNTEINTLYKSWNFKKVVYNKANQTLSYNAAAYNTPATQANDYIINPLNYDIEPYNFLRIEEHIGLHYAAVLKYINSIKTTKRLPFDVIALSTGTPDLSKMENFVESDHIKDLETSYELVRREWEAIVGKTIEYIDNNKKAIVTLLGGVKGSEAMLTNYLVKLHEGKKYMVTELNKFIDQYDKFLVPVYEDLESRGQKLRDEFVNILIKATKDPDRTLLEDVIDQVDEVTLSCKKGGFRALYQQYKARIEDIYSNLFFSHYVNKNPGIQHKAGVTMGGTFILVYHKKDAGDSKRSPIFLDSKLNTTALNAISDGTVIGDFYVPYNCCSGLTPIQFNIPPAPNLQPVAVATSNVTSITIGDGVTLTLNGTQSYDMDGSIQKYAWSKSVDSPECTIVSPDAPVTNVTLLAPGNHHFILVVTDDKNTPSSPATVDVLVIKRDTPPLSPPSSPPASPPSSPPSSPPVSRNRPPVAVVTSNVDTINLGSNVTLSLDGSASHDTDGGSIKSFNWSASKDSPLCNIIQPNEKTTTVTNLVEGVYTFILIVTDNQNAKSAQGSVTVTVKEASQKITCVDVLQNYKSFDANRSSDKLFKVFQQLTTYVHLADYLKILEDQLINKPEEQIKFFDEQPAYESIDPETGKTKSVMIENALVLWRQELRDLILENKEMRLLASALYRIVADLTFYIACIQTTDINERNTRVLMSIVLNNIQKDFDSFTFKEFTEVEKNEFMNILLDCQQEVLKINFNNEGSSKSAYLKWLSNAIEFLKGQLL